MKYELRPYVLSLRTTERCNVGCYHCSLSAKPTGRDMPIELGIDAIRTAAKAGIGLLHVSGGEPLLYPQLPVIVEEGKAAGMVVEIVTSTFTQPENEEVELSLLRKLAACGLDTVILSYDDGHAQRVGIEKVVRFTQEAIELGLDICIFGIESPHVSITIDKIAEAFSRHGINSERLDWASAMFSYAGRGATCLPSCLPNEGKASFARCPYVMPVPTILPDGKFLLCPCSILQSEHFIIGDYHRDGMEKVLYNFRHSPIYRMLGKLGPQMSLLKCGMEEKDIPFEICYSCEKYLQIIAAKSKIELDELFDNQWLEEIYVDFDALLPPHRKYLLEHVHPVTGEPQDAERK